MKKINIVVLTIMFLFLMPFVKAETCDCSGIKIDSVELDNIEGSAQELNEPKIEDNKIDLDVKLYKVNDSIDYKIVIKNTAKGNINIDESMLKKNTDYIEYEYIYEGSNVLKPNEEKEVILRIKYKNKVPKESFEGDITSITEKVSLNLNGDGTVVNPKTGLVSSTTYLIIALVLGTVLALMIIKEKKAKTATAVALILLIPLSIHAVCGCKIETSVKIDIDLKEAVFDVGEVVNLKMKRLAGNAVENTKTEDNNVTSILKSSTSPNIEEMTEDNIVSSSESELPIYMWFDNGTMYWWSEDETPSLNADASYMFKCFKSLTNVLGLKDIDASGANTLQQMFHSLTSITDYSPISNWDISNVTSIRSTFNSNTSLVSLEPLRNWDTSNVTSMHGTFMGNSGVAMSIASLEPLSNWNTSKVTDMHAIFQNNAGLTSLNGVENWDTSKVTDMQNLIGGLVELNITDISALRNWDVSNVTNMIWAFENANKLTSIEALRNWDVSNVEEMEGMFATNRGRYGSLTDIEPLRNWNVGKVTDMDYLFQFQIDIVTLEPLKKWNTSNVTTMLNFCIDCRNVTTLEGLEDWDVSKVENMASAFENMTSLTDASAINDWNITSVTNFTNMFSDTPVHPEFTKASGTWSGGTFIRE